MFDHIGGDDYSPDCHCTECEATREADAWEWQQQDNDYEQAVRGY